MRNTLPPRRTGQIGHIDDVAIRPEMRDQLSYLVHDMQSVVTSVSLMVELLEIAARAWNDSTHQARAVLARNSCRQMALLCTEAARLLDKKVDGEPVPQEFDLQAVHLPSVLRTREKTAARTSDQRRP